MNVIGNHLATKLHPKLPISVPRPLDSRCVKAAFKEIRATTRQFFSHRAITGIGDWSTGIKVPQSPARNRGLEVGIERMAVSIVISGGTSIAQVVAMLDPVTEFRDHEGTVIGVLWLRSNPFTSWITALEAELHFSIPADR